VYESINESPNYAFFGVKTRIFGETRRNFNVICSVHAFFHIFSKLLPQSLKFRGWDRFDGIRRIHSINHSGLETESPYFYPSYIAPIILKFSNESHFGHPIDNVPLPGFMPKPTAVCRHYQLPKKIGWKISGPKILKS
jgi:hypothetical protein